MRERPLHVVDYFDTPEVLDAGVTPIPGSLSPPLQVVAKLHRSAYVILVRDGIQDEFIGLYRGPVGSEQLVCIFGIAPETKIDAFFAENDRISIRSMSVPAITHGSLCVQFLGLNAVR